MRIEILLSGLCGAVLATFISLIYHYVSEQTRLRRQVMIEVVTWLDEIYERLQVIQIYKERVYTGKEPSLTAEEYRVLTNEVRVRLLSEKVKTLVVLTYGEGERLQKINAIQGELQKAAQLIWASTKDNWNQYSGKIMGQFSKVIDPIKDKALKDFFMASRSSAVLKDAVKIKSAYKRKPMNGSGENSGRIKMLRTFIQVLALSLALLSSFFLVKGVVTLTVNDLAELSSTKWGYNLHVLRNLTFNRADTMVGFWLLISSFLLQMSNLLWPMRWCDFTINKKGVLFGLLVAGVVFVVSVYAARYLQKKYYSIGEKVLKERTQK